jgi:hypothetical protein
MEQFGPRAPISEASFGDLASTERGSAARSAEARPQWWQLPLWALADVIQMFDRFSAREDDLLARMSEWQRGGDKFVLERALAVALRLIQCDLGAGATLRDALAEICGVLEYGALKYSACPPEKRLGKDGRPAPAAAGNWAKGMPWSVCYGCAVSHVLYRVDGEAHDKESGRLHSAHAATNLMFLLAYYSLFPEGDDRIVQFRSPT